LGLNRLGVDAAEQWIRLAVNLLTADFMACAKAPDASARGSVHGVGDEEKVAPRNGLQIDHGFDVAQIGANEITKPERLRAPFRAVAGCSAGQVRFDLLNNGRIGRAAVAGLEFESVPLPGVVAGRDDNGAGGLALAHGKGNRGSRRETIRRATGGPGAGTLSRGGSPKPCAR